MFNEVRPPLAPLYSPEHQDLEKLTEAQEEVELGFEPKVPLAQSPALEPWDVLTLVAFWCLKQDGHTSAFSQAGQRQ